MTTDTNDTTRRTPITPGEARDAVLAVEQFGTIALAADALALTRPALQRRIRKAKDWGITAHGEIDATPAPPLAPHGRGPQTFLFTAAQSNTHVHEGFWANLKAFAAHRGAQIVVSRVRYNHTAQHLHQEKDNRRADNDLWYAPEIKGHIEDRRMTVARGLIWAGDTNIIPSAAGPLTGLDSFTGLASCIFPHSQIALKAVSTPKGVPAKHNYTTGMVTLSNYIKRTAGLKAEFHHAYGALLVEVDGDGQHYSPRQINADENGTFYDLSTKVEDGVVTEGHRIKALVPGDLHGTRIDPNVLRAIWGADGVADTLRPEIQVLHDVLDFNSRSHHNSVFDQIASHYAATESVEDELSETAKVINRTHRDDCETYVSKSNHDEHLERWLREANWRNDPVNAVFYLAAAGACVQAIKSGDESFDVAAWGLYRAGVSPEIRFLKRDEELTVAGIRLDLHGDRGPNGSRGSPAAFARIGEKTVTAHGHYGAIHQGNYSAGTSSLLEMGYNSGPSNWSHTFCIIYPNGKRALITLDGDRWRLPPDHDRSA